MKRKHIFIMTLIIIMMLLLTGCSVNDNNSKREPIEENLPTSYQFSIKYYSDGSFTSHNYDDYKDITLKIPKPADGYSFLGWATVDGVLITENNLAFLGEHKTIELFAQWHATSYLVELDANEGMLDSAPIILYNIETSTFNLPTPNREGFTFLGWENNNNTIINEVEQGNFGNIRLVAQWKLIDYTISYILDGGICDNLITDYTIDSDNIVLPTPTKYEASFLGWYTAANFTGDKITTIDTSQMLNIQLYARWENIIYTIEYDLTGGFAQGLPTKFSYYSNDINLKDYRVSRSNYKFQGFYRDADALGSPIDTISHIDIGNIKLYAAWVDSDATDNIAYAFHQNLNGGYYSARAIGNTGDFIIPDTYKNKQVLAIDDGGFKNLNKASVIIKGGMLNIGDFAFTACQSTVITINYGVKVLGVEAMSNGRNISVIVPGSLGKGLGNGVFMNTINSTISLDYGITAIPDNAFNGFVGEKINIPSSVEKIGDHALSNMTSYNDSGITLTMGGNIKYYGKVINSRISSIEMDSRQDFVPHSFIKQLYYIDAGKGKLYMTNVIMTNRQLQGITQTIFNSVLGFNNQRFRADLECKTLLSDRETIVGHFSMAHPEQVCMRVKYQDSNREKILFNLAVMNTLSHEIRHYFQKLHVHGSINGISKDSVPKALRPTALQVSDWHKPYISEPYSEYYHQPVEEDARHYAYLLTGYNPYHNPCNHPKCSEINNEYPVALINLFDNTAVYADTKQHLCA